jgi:mRNA capping enzyme, catalytic domain/mRNA capping enzyme
MSIELKSSESVAIQQLWEQWKASDQYELESCVKNVDLTSFQDTVARLRAVGLREQPQQPKLNIMMPGCLRFSIVGQGMIQAYCQHGDITKVPYDVVIKERCKKGEKDQIDLPDYSVRIKMRREIPLDKRDARVIEILGRWARTPKRFRYLRRFTFLGPEDSGVRFDLTAVRESKKDTKGDYMGSETFQMADILRRPLSYEIESEVERNDKTLAMKQPKSFLNSIGLILQGIQKSFVLVRRRVADEIIGVISAATKTRPKSFPGPQPVTLERANIALEQEPNIANLRFGDYNVTDKADGQRCLLIVAADGRIYLVDNILRVYGTGLRLEAAAATLYKGTVLDGEWIRRNKAGESVSLYYAFDIYTTAQGKNVTELPFLTTDSDVHRLAVLKETIAALSDAKQTAKDVPPSHSLLITIKTFYSTGGGGIFRDAAACLDAAAQSAYYTDGLIFTPNNAPLPVGGGSWNDQLKWKPAHDNTIDFLVVAERTETGADKISFKYREDEKQMMRYKTLRLFVGGKMDAAFRDPRDTILNKKPLPESTRPGEYRPVEFTPQEPADPMASVCYAALDAGVADPAGATPASQDLEAKDNAIYCTRSGDPITTDCIVEMAYHPEKPAGWRWEPTRVRWDKTERFQRGEMGRTMNADWVADNIWSSIHNPVSETMIRTGNLVDEAAGEKPYYVPKRSVSRDNFKIAGLARFHNQYIKSETLLQRTLRKGDALLDLACGRAGDIHKWIKSQAGWVLGVDKNLDCLTASKGGAYGRYLDQLIDSKVPLPPMVFVQASSTQNIRDMTAGATDLDKRILRALYDFPEKAETPAAVEPLRGFAAKGFDVVSCMFALHYFFQDRSTVDGFLRNIADNLKIGGFFVGCCFDGDSVYKLLEKTSENGVKSGNDGQADIWSIRRMYGAGTEDVLMPTDAGLGKAIDVFFMSIGEEHREYLVSWEYLKMRLHEIGCEVLLPDELNAMKLKSSSALFSESYPAVEANCVMPDAAKQFSFLNRWFIFRRRSNGTVKAVVREEPAVAEPIPVAAAAASPASEDRPIYKFYHGSPLKDELKLGRKDWARYLSTFSYSRIRDTKTPTVIYPSLEAAFAAARFQYGTDMPELGAKLFATTGSIHQKFLKIRRTEGAIEDKRNAELLEEEGSAVRDLIKPAEIKRLGAKWNEAAWTAARDKVMGDYVQIRYDTDPEFKRIMDAIKAKNGRLVFYNGSKPSELGGVVKADGSVEGQNKLGQFYMATVGLSA